ncbi:MAG: pyrroline-5-carboxylate reductase [Oscillospiraceae bacterium]|jgi:pyrroline-5-carboxylate reductase|nr:pyrroline-5-carboxylate reductase [Oscillospiraceae bacterium]
MTENTFGIIGAGNMGGAFAKAVAEGGKVKSVLVYDNDAEKTAALPCEQADSAADVVRHAKYVLLSVKPQQLDELLTDIKDSITTQTVLISICAGVSDTRIKNLTSPETKVVLVMPNTPATLGAGASAYAAGTGVTKEELLFVKTLLDSCGVSEEIPIDKMKEIIAVNGSSPAFLYLFAKTVVDYADSVGIDREVALKLFAQTLVGSAKMLTDSGKSPEELITQVSSPGGTTLAGLSALRQHSFEETITAACAACTSRAYALGQSE